MTSSITQLSCFAPSTIYGVRDRSVDHALCGEMWNMQRKFAYFGFFCGQSKLPSPAEYHGREMLYALELYFYAD